MGNSGNLDALNFFRFFDYQTVLIIACTFIIFAIFFILASSQQRKAVTKVDRALKLQEQSNQTLTQILSEVRRSNRLLALLAEMDIQDLPPEMLSESTEGSNAPVAQNTDQQTKLYVGNIDYRATESELADLFAPYGKIANVNIPVNRYNGRARGFGFVTFANYEEAERAMALNGAEFKGRQIQVNFAREREIV